MTRARLKWASPMVLVALVGGALPLAQAAPVAPVPIATQVFCDPIDTSACLLPFPNNFFTTPDATTDTGLRINFSPDAMPRNGTEAVEGGEGKPVDPTELNRNDGFSPGSMVMTYVPEIDLHQTWGTADRPHSEVVGTNGYFDYRDHITDINMYQREDAPIVIIDAATGERFPFWSEVDSHPNATDAEEQVLIMRPARNFEEGHRYIVALRNLKKADGSTIPTGAAFASIRDNTTPTIPELPQIAARRAQYQSDILPTLEAAGVARGDLYLAWDFTIASERNLSERILTIRDDAFTRLLGDPDLSDRKVEGTSPVFMIDEVAERTDNWGDSHGTSHSQQIRRVSGRITVPNYMDRIQQNSAHVQKPCRVEIPDPVGEGAPCDLPAPGSRFYDDPADADSLPDQNPVESTVNVPFICDMVLSRDGQPIGEQSPMLYGHGLLGERGQLGDLVKSPIRSGPFMGCAVDWWGMSFADLPTVVSIIADASNFPSLADRAQQGFLNFMYVGRALIHDAGFAADPAFQDADGNSLIRTAGDNGGLSTLHYDGNSQGGIMGGSLTAVSPDINRAVLGVTGMNYSTLLQRSVDWEDLYAIPFYAAYQDPIEQQVVFSLMQMLWDRGETNGYAAHLTSDPLPNTPDHQVMMQVAYGDHQVTNISAEVQAATIGAPVMEHAAEHWANVPFLETATYPYDGSALIYWNSGNATPPNGNLPNNDCDCDPHGHPRDERASSWQEAHWLLTGQLYDVCAGGPYLTRRHPSNNGTASCLEPDFAPGSETSSFEWNPHVPEENRPDLPKRPFSR